jgi:Lon protease-like protein
MRTLEVTMARSPSSVRKPVIHYASLHNVLHVGDCARVVTTDHYISGLNGCKVFVGPIVRILERVNDNRPVFETTTAVFIPDDVSVTDVAKYIVSTSIT